MLRLIMLQMGEEIRTQPESHVKRLVNSGDVGALDYTAQAAQPDSEDATTVMPLGTPTVETTRSSEEGEKLVSRGNPGKFSK